MVNGNVPGGNFDPRRALVGDRKEETPLHKWAEDLTPNWTGKVAGGLYGCVLTYMDPGNERFIWTFGWGATRGDAREQAIQNMVEQRLRNVMWLPEDMK